MCVLNGLITLMIFYVLSFYVDDHLLAVGLINIGTVVGCFNIGTIMSPKRCINKQNQIVAPANNGNYFMKSFVPMLPFHELQHCCSLVVT